MHSHLNENTDRPFRSLGAKALHVATVAIMLVPVELFDGIYIAHAYIIFLLALTLARTATTARRPTALTLIALTAFIALIELRFFAFADKPEFFFQENAKLIFLLVGAWSFANLINRRQYSEYVRTFSAAFVPTCLLLSITTEDPFSYGGRLQLPQFGSPNTLAIILSLCCTALLFAISQANSLRRITLLFVFLIAIGLLALTSSRGGAFALLLAITAFLNARTLAVVFLCGSLAIALLVATNPNLGDLYGRYLSFQEGYSSGRIEIWTHLLDTLIRNDEAILIGFGGGSISVHLFDKTIISAHSGLLTIFYYYGLFFLLAFLIFASVKGYHLARSASVDKPLRLGVFLVLTFTFLTDNLFLASQATIYVCFFMGLLFSKPEKTVGVRPPPSSLRGNNRRGPLLDGNTQLCVHNGFHGHKFGSTTRPARSAPPPHD